MANIRKTFNFRNGVQVDEDNFIVDSLGKVGVGTTVPNQMLDVRGNAKVVGILTSQSLETRNVNVAGVTTFSGTVHVGAAITIYPASGIISATSIRGDGRNLINIPTSQWTDLNSGLGHTSIYNEGFVGVSTNDPRFTFQVGGNNDLTTFASGVGINSTGNIVATGVITATNFKGDLQGNQVIGNLIGNVNATSGVSTVGTVKFDSGHVYNTLSVGSTNLNVSGVSTLGVSTFTGNVSFGSSALFGDNDRVIFGGGSDLQIYHSSTHSWIEDTGTGNLVLKGSRVDIQDTSGNELLSAEGGQYVKLSYGATERLRTSTTGVTVNGVAVAGQFTGAVNAGVATITSKLDLDSISSQGINTSTPQSNIHVYQSGISSVHLESGSNESVITLGRGLNKQTTSGGVRYGNTSGAFPYSTVDSLDIINYATGNVNFYLEGGANSSTPGNFYWHKRANQTRLMTLTSTGRLGIGVTDPINALHVVGTTTCTNDIFAGSNVSLKGNAEVIGNLTVLGDFNPVEISSNFTGNVTATVGVSTFLNLNATGDTYTQQLGIGLANGTDLGTNRLVINSGNQQTWVSATGRLGVRTDSISNGAALDTGAGTALFGAVGVGTTSVRCTADFNAAGYDGGAGTASFMILPRVSNAERGNLTNLMSGALVYNTSTNKLNFYNGSAWRAVTDAGV
mgnify:FL=1